MRVASIGDLHLAHRPRLDGFRGPESELLGLLDHLEANHDRIVLLGDLIASDYGRLPGSRADVVHATLDRYGAVARRWRSEPYVMVFGNHDVVLEQELGARESVDFEHEGFRAHLIHGHQYDPLIGKLAQPTTWTLGLARRLGGGPLVDRIEGPLFRKLQQRAGRRGSPERAAMSMLDAGGHDVIVMGHTHVVRCEAGIRGVYANSGALTARFLAYTSIDLNRREVRVCQLRGGRPEILGQWRAAQSQ